MSEENKMSIAQKTAKLSELVAWFDGDDFELEQALDKFSDVEKLAEEIEHDLTTIKNNINVVKTKFTEQE